ncbi:MAG TPA: hypothetical protein VEK07_20125 [Polyangiaceae bacterium]|nr:hypothetical protein [Polyangiaceae bacterium]
MRTILRYSAPFAVVVAAACATAGGNGPPGGPGSGPGSSIGPGNTLQQQPDATLSNSNYMTSGPNDSGEVLGADGAVIGTCVLDHTEADGGTCDPMCNQLQENGSSDYIEPHPDDGSALPPGPTSALDAMFANPSTSGGPCIMDPPDGSLFPNNWLRPRIFYSPSQTTGTVYYQIRIHADNQANDLIVYTESRSWEIPKDIWQGLAATTWNMNITVTVSEVSSTGGTATSSQVTFQIAPANANGSMIYWAAVGDENGFAWLEGFRVADEGVSNVLTVPTGPFSNAATNVQWQWSRDSGGNLSTMNRTLNTPLTPTGDAQCIGCHVAVPDGNSIAFVDFYPWDGVVSSVNPDADAGVAVGQPPPWLTPGGAETLSQGCLGMMAFSSDVWNSGSHLVIAGTQVPKNATNNPWAEIGGDTNASNLIWIDLSTTAPPTFVSDAGTPLPSISIPDTPFYANQGTTYDYIARPGDTNSASTPAWSHSGTQIIYASNNAPESGRLAMGSSDLYTLTFDPGTKQSTGNATALPGASSSSVNEYYPAFSPDDRYVAFNSAPPANPMYYNADAEIDIVPANAAAGTTVTPTRLKANDPPSCMRTEDGGPSKSPGVTNSWARWSPEYPTCSGLTYYWLIFSSSRLGIPFTATTTPQNFQKGNPNENTSQLYLTGITVDSSGNVTTYPATYIWNQPISATAAGVTWNQSNHTPAWSVVEIPPPQPAAPPPPPR